MKLYRIQARYGGKHFDHTIESSSDEQVIVDFTNDLNAGKVKIAHEDLTNPSLCHITYEEIDHEKISRPTGPEDSVRV